MAGTLNHAVAGRRRRRLPWGEISRYVAMLVLAFITLLPIFVMISTSFKSPLDIQSRVPIWFFMPTFGNYEAIITQNRFLPFLISSAVIGLGATGLTLLTGGMAAFALARMRFPGRGLIAHTTLVIRMIPPAVLAVTVIGFWIAWGIGDLVSGIRFTLPQGLGRGDFLDGSQLGLMLFYTALNLPFSIWLLFGFIRQIPVELEEAAIVDGANLLQVLFRVIFPLMGAGFAVSAIFTFRIAWNEFILALMLTTRFTKTLPVFAAEFMRDEGVLWGQLMAAGTLIVIPPMLITFFAAQQIIQGVSAGAVKG